MPYFYEMQEISLYGIRRTHMQKKITMISASFGAVRHVARPCAFLASFRIFFGRRDDDPMAALSFSVHDYPETRLSPDRLLRRASTRATRAPTDPVSGHPQCRLRAL